MGESFIVVKLGGHTLRATIEHATLEEAFAAIKLLQAKMPNAVFGVFKRVAVIEPPAAEPELGAA